MSLNRRVWSLSAPIMLSNISLPLLSLVDTAVMGHLNSAVYLAAVAVGAMVLHFIFWGFGFLRMSTVGLTAQSYGAKDGAELRHLLVRAAVFAVVISFLLIVIQTPMINLALYFVQPGAEVSLLTKDYFYIRIWAAPATLLTYVCVGWLLGIHRAHDVLWVMVFINVLNIILDLVFVVGFGWHVKGVAWASLLAEFSGLILALWLVKKSLCMMPAQLQWQQVFQWPAFRQLASMNLDIYIRTISLLFVFAFFTTQSARAGEVVVAANAILLQFLTFMAYVLDAYAHAAEAMVGEAIGDKNSNRVKEVVKICLQWSLWTSLLFSLLYLLAGEHIIALLTNIEEVREYSSSYLYWLALLPVVAVWSYLFDGVFIGATWSREMRDVMLMAVFIVFLPVWLMTQSLQNHGLWLSMLIFLAARGSLMAWFYRKKLLYIKIK